MLHFIWMIQVAMCFYMTGVIWIIQGVQYPSFLYVAPPLFPEFHRAHTFKMGFLVGPAMILELSAAALLCFYNPSGAELFFLSSVLLLWGWTFGVSVPLHSRLEKAYEKRSIQLLIRTNWFRTFLWSLRSGALLYLLWKGYL